MKILGYYRITNQNKHSKKLLNKQIKPLTNSIIDYDTKLGRSLKFKLFSDAYAGTKQKRPNLEKMLSVAKSHDTLIFLRLSQMGRSLSRIWHMIANYAVTKHVQIHVCKGDWTFDNNTKSGKYQIQLFKSIIGYKKDLTAERMMDSRLAKKPRKGPVGRFYGKNRKHYLCIYHYASGHSQSRTAEHFGISPRTVYRIEKSGHDYFNLKKV